MSARKPFGHSGVRFLFGQSLRKEASTGESRYKQNYQAPFDVILTGSNALDKVRYRARFSIKKFLSVVLTLVQQHVVRHIIPFRIPRDS